MYLHLCRRKEARHHLHLLGDGVWSRVSRLRTIDHSVVIFIIRKNDSTLRGPTSGLFQSDTSISFLLIFVIIDDEIADIVIRVLALFIGRVDNADRPGPPSWQNAASRSFALTLDVVRDFREIIIHINIISGRLFFTHLLICGFEGFARKYKVIGDSATTRRARPFIGLVLIRFISIVSSGSIQNIGYSEC